MAPNPTPATSPSLRTLLALPVMVPVGAQNFPVKPMGWYQAAEAMEPIVQLMADMPALFAGAPSKVDAWMAAVMGYREDISAFLALATGYPEDDVRALAPHHAAELLLGTVEVNADFFGQALPLLARNMGRRMEALTQRLAPALEAAHAELASASSKMAQALQPTPPQPGTAACTTSSSAS